MACSRVKVYLFFVNILLVCKFRVFAMFHNHWPSNSVSFSVPTLSIMTLPRPRIVYRYQLELFQAYRLYICFLSVSVAGGPWQRPKFYHLIPSDPELKQVFARELYNHFTFHKKKGFRRNLHIILNSCYPHTISILSGNRVCSSSWFRASSMFLLLVTGN